MMRKFILLIAALLVMISCNKIDNGDRRDKASYMITITGSEGGPHVLVGEEVDSNWDQDIGVIYLGTDANNEPLGTVTLTIGNITAGEAPIISAIVSKTDVRVGTGDEINGRTFFLPELGGLQKVENITVGANFISGEINLSLEGDVPGSNATESVTVAGEFVALE
jgi:hypothetical protein